MNKSLISLAIAAGLAFPAHAQQSVEVLHWWTSGGEAAALNVLKNNLEKQGVKWNDMPVAGGGGEAAMTAVRARVTSGNPPTAVQMLGLDIQDWAKQGVLADLNPIAAKEGWDKVVPAALQKFSKYNGKWIAAPVNIHSTNWIWANKEVLAKAGVTTEPKSWDEFIAAAEKVQKAGMVISGKAGFQIMGDWAKGEFINAKKVPDKDFLCYRFPGTQGVVSFNADQFAMFKLSNADKSAAQVKLAAAILDPAFQSAFNVVKGSAPARSDVPDTAFDDCGKKAIKDVAEASRNNKLVGSIAHGHAVPASIKNAFYDVITRHFNGQLDDKKAVAAMVSATKN